MRFENKKTPAEVWYNVKPNVKNMKVFGSPAYAHVPKEIRQKLDDKAIDCIFMGYTNNSYRLWDLKRKKIIISRGVVVNEKALESKGNIIEFTNENEEIELLHNKDSTEDIDKINPSQETMETKDTNKELNNEIENNESVDEEVEFKDTLENNYEKADDIPVQNERKVSKRETKLPARLKDYQMNMAFDAVSYVEQIPQEFNELKIRKDCNDWMLAIKRELESINTNETWVETTKPGNKEILDTTWIFSFK